jgi:UDP-N-acetylenolpyruvoylglucosamine reductase
MEDVQNAPLARYTTLKIGGDADRLCHPQNVDELVALVAELKAANQPWYVIGGGSNLLISSAGLSRNSNTHHSNDEHPHSRFWSA